ncbi:MAG: hypothetical protein IIB36_00750 [Gemmatimonadetes bacterium]|nr:hypothetical protein [Gemmatimonadota bacterium]
MRPLHRLGAWTLPVCGLAMLMAQGVAGQDVDQQATRWYPYLDRQHDAAMAHYTPSKGGLEEAAWRHGLVSLLRTEDDARRFECLLQQAQILHALGHADASRAYLEEAAQQAEATGDTYGAAMTFVDAAIVAQETGDGWSARELAGKARALVSSPNLDINQRAAVLRRLDPGW